MRNARGSALWGKKGDDARGHGFQTRGLVLLGLALALSGPAIAKADYSKSPIDPNLAAAMQVSPNGNFPVIVQGDKQHSPDQLAQAVANALSKSRHLNSDATKSLVVQFQAQFANVSDVVLTARASEITSIAQTSGILSITRNVAVTAEGYENHQHWVEGTGAKWNWGSPYMKAPAGTIAIVDSGIDNSLGQFGSRIVASVDLGSGSTADPRGHGTFVASIAAGAGAYSGVAPNANLVGVNVFNAQGQAKTSDVIHACDWMLQNKSKYGIRVANLSLITAQPSSFLYDPLDKAVERLWEAGIVVVTPSGNYASGNGPSGVLYAPGNDPFVITVGAADTLGQNDPTHYTNAPWSAYGYTPDGFAKPEIGAPGRYMIAQVPTSATLYSDYPGQALKNSAIELSGTSFSTAAVSGMAAAIVGAHPDWSPDQVKGALMLFARPDPRAATNSLGVGEANLQKVLEYYKDGSRGVPPNPNQAIESFLVADPSGGSLPVFDSDRWASVAKANASWDAASWTSAAWTSASWTSAAWTSASWTSAAWTSASWTSAAWTSASWTSAAWTNNAALDGLGDG